MAGWGPRKRRTVGIHLAVALALTTTLAAGMWRLFSERWLVPDYLAAWLTAANLVAFCYYGVDKGLARRGERRVPEVVLHALGVVGGALGAYAGMRFFRHKTIKGSFRVLFWLIVALQVVIVVWLVWR